ncbi:hypothetical protein Lyticum_00118 [Lyticum sinuosum]|uniref:Uncharacterized protein n=1 Tax=Lyticum sinuosum TaxID=1332059 RepID=A0AAE4VLG8_9RICK|nr:hypothetical protein [Lyticum sinuosum]
MISKNMKKNIQYIKTYQIYKNSDDINKYKKYINIIIYINMNIKLLKYKLNIKNIYKYIILSIYNFDYI